MLADASPKTHAVRLSMHDRAEMNSVYNQFAYQKAATVLLMLENWLGEKPFRDGLRAYLRDHRFGQATTADLASALRDASGTDPAPVMHAFLDQPGIPTIRAEVHCDTGKTPHVSFEQTNSAGSWPVPVYWRTDSQPASCFVLDTTRRDVALPSGSRPVSCLSERRRHRLLSKRVDPRPGVRS